MTAGCPECGSSVEATGELCEHQRRILTEALMPPLAKTPKQEIYDLLLARANGRLVDQVLVDVSSQLNVGVDEVVSAMWDLVERGDLDYGTNARVTRRDPNDLAPCSAVRDLPGDDPRICELPRGHEGSHRARLTYCEGWATWQTSR